MNQLYLILLILLTSGNLFSQEVQDYQVKTSENATERKAILDLARGSILKEIHQDVVFNVTHLKVSNGFAWFQGNAIRKDGKEIELPDDSYDCCHAEGLFQKKNGKWIIVEFSSFSTDCWFCQIALKYPKVPKGIFTSSALGDN